MPLITDLIAELDAADEALLPPLEGFRDLSRALTPRDGGEATQFVDSAINTLVARQSAINNARSVLRTLVGTGYPEAIVFAPNPETQAVVRGQLETITAAIGTIKPLGEAVSADVQLGTPVPR